ncbi:trypsin-like serine protease [Corynebacterium phoceense]|uniref:trypsin-like serine protease n=2 Tax=Corynebacterium phoceense TaxID=1686286 RepID=UPI003B967B3C
MRVSIHPMTASTMSLLYVCFYAGRVPRDLSQQNTRATRAGVLAQVSAVQVSAVSAAVLGAASGLDARGGVRHNAPATYSATSQVLLGATRYPGRAACTGSLLNDRWVLTARHCFQSTATGAHGWKCCGTEATGVRGAERRVLVARTLLRGGERECPVGQCGAPNRYSIV